MNRYCLKRLLFSNFPGGAVQKGVESSQAIIIGITRHLNFPPGRG